MGRKSISVAIAVAVALITAHPARAQTVIDDWNQVKLPPPPALKPVTLVAKETALLVMDFTVQTCTPERRKKPSQTSLPWAGRRTSKTSSPPSSI